MAEPTPRESLEPAPCKGALPHVLGRRRRETPHCHDNGEAPHDRNVHPSATQRGHAKVGAVNSGTIRTGRGGAVRGAWGVCGDVLGLAQCNDRDTTGTGQDRDEEAHVNETMTLTVRGNVGWLLKCRPGLGDLAASSATPLLPVLSLIVLVPVPRIEQGAEDRHIHGHVVASSSGA